MIAHADGSNPRVVTTGSDPAWSPDGSQLAVVDQGGVWLVSTDEQKRRLLIAGGRAPDWSPDGKHLVIEHGAEGISIVNADGSGLRSVTQGFNPVWSPDGTEIAFTSDLGSSCVSDPIDEAVCEIHPDGSGERALEPGLDETISEYDPTWGPTPGQLAFVKVNPTTGDGDPHIVLWPSLLHVTTSPAGMPIIVRTASGRQVASFESGGQVRALAVSRRVVAALVREPGGHSAIETYQPQRRIVPLRDTPFEQLSTAANLLVFQTGYTIDTLNVNRGTPKPVATTSGVAIGLSIVGNRIAWAENPGPNTVIRALSIRH